MTNWAWHVGSLHVRIRELEAELVEARRRVAELVKHVNELHAERKDGWSHTVKDVMARSKAEAHSETHEPGEREAD